MQFRKRLNWAVNLSVLLLGWVTGCEQAAPPQPPAPPLTNAAPPPTPAMHLDHALPKLKTIKLWVGSQVIETELAMRTVEVATGMMYRKEMGENEGMLFVFGRPYRVSFYMKNTYVPLSAGYIGADGTLLEIRDLKPLDETPVEAQSDEVQFVLEVKQGWFERHKIPVGTVVRTEFGSLPETFFRRQQ